jgi:hypothetical protein
MLIAVATFGQADKTVILKWKLRPNEVLSYRTIIQDIDTIHAKDLSIDMGPLADLVGDSAKQAASKARQELSAYNKSIEDNGLIFNLAEKKPGIIDIEMVQKEKEKDPEAKKDTSDAVGKRLSEMMKKMMGSVMLRASIAENGSIQSFYTKNEQKNLIAMFFELPDKPIKLGDTWSLDMNYISMDQNFTCDTSFKRNVASLVGLKQVGNETIAVIKFDMIEYVLGDFRNPIAGKSQRTMMKMTYKGIAEFSVESGRWESYDGIMSMTASGFMTANSTQKFALIPN